MKDKWWNINKKISGEILIKDKRRDIDERKMVKYKKKKNDEIIIKDKWWNINKRQVTKY
jgi:hypothetical protein